MKKYFALAAFVLMFQLSCQQRRVVCTPEKEEVTTPLYNSTTQRYDSLCEVLLKGYDTIGSLPGDVPGKTACLASFLHSVHLDDGGVGTLTGFDSCDITFFNTFFIGGEIYDFIPVAQLPGKCRELISDLQQVSGSKIYAGDTLIRIEGKDLVNAADYAWDAAGPLVVALPERLMRIKSKTGELFYFTGSTAMGKNWVIGFLFKSKEKYRMKILLADMFEDTWVRANKPEDGVALILGKSINRSFDSIAFSRYNISMDGRIRREGVDSVLLR